MAWPMVAAAVVGAVSSIAGGLSAKGAAEDAGERQAESILMAEKENRRRRENELKRQLGTIDSRVYASNILMTGSAKRYRDDYKSQYRQEMAWDKAKANMDARAARKGAEAMGDAAMYQGIGSAIGYAAQGVSAWPSSTPKGP